MKRCSFPPGVEVKVGGAHEVDPCFLKDVEIHRNVTVIVSRCKRCGRVDISWVRQDNTEDIILEEEPDEP